ncbi:xanthine dehydrogenase family protein subunit M [soil metagenome]
MLRLHEYRYYRPESLSAALELLGRDDAMAIAGGTDLMPNMKHRLFSPNHLVALKGIREMRGIELTTTEAGVRELRIGAGETLSEIAHNPLVVEHLPSLAEAAGAVAGPQIRNQGTIGGNLCLDTRCTYYNQSFFWRQALGFCLKKDGDICHVTKVGRKCVAAHSADTPPALISVGAMIDLASPGGTRSIPVADFFVSDGTWNTVRRPGEILVRVRVPIPEIALRTAYEKIRQRQSIDFPLLSMAAAARVGAGEIVESLVMVVTALGARPRIVSGIEKVAVGRPLPEIVEEVAQLAFKQCHPLENIIVDPEWRHAMVPVYARRLLRRLSA